MVSNKSLDEIEVIAALLRDAHASYGVVFNNRALRLTLQKVRNRARLEGLGFLTKTLPRLGKYFDQALAAVHKFNAGTHHWKVKIGSELPRFLGELFELVFHKDGTVLPDPDATCVRLIRDILYCFYKYELPYTEVQEQQIIDAFKSTEEDLSKATRKIHSVSDALAPYIEANRRRQPVSCLPSGDTDMAIPKHELAATREARILLSNLFSQFDPTDITPNHGPGVVSTKETLSEKFCWTNVSNRITSVFPFDAYFCASAGHVCDTFDSFDTITETDHPARVVLVPKDSRGPRLISCEPVDFQWVQQGMRKAIYRLVEDHYLTKHNVFFTDQVPNRLGALLGSTTGRYATLDLKEASDRVSLGLVRLLFPEHVYTYLVACRSTSTVLPNGEKMDLLKYAPMGSALCFPVLALTIWALLTAHAPDADTREGILVYGDDVIVPTTYVESAMAILEAFGLLINRAKSCTQGSFRESCGMDAFKGVNVTPVRIRTVWESTPRPDVYTSWIAYANSYYDKRRYHTYNYIVAELEAIYGPIPGEDMHLACPSLRCSPVLTGRFKKRNNIHLQKMEYRVRVVESPSVTQVVSGWSMLLRYFTEKATIDPNQPDQQGKGLNSFRGSAPSSVSQYTKRYSSKLKYRWR